MGARGSTFLMRSASKTKRDGSLRFTPRSPGRDATTQSDSPQLIGERGSIERRSVRRYTLAKFGKSIQAFVIVFSRNSETSAIF